MSANDAYIRLAGQSADPVWLPNAGRGVVFLDVVDDPTAVWERVLSVALRAVPVAMLGRAETIVVRLPDFAIRRQRRKRAPSATDALRASMVDVLREFAPNATIAELRQPVGAPASVGGVPSELETLRYARALEIAALIERGHALWESDGHHFRLPSGQHSRRFLRVGDAITDVRDAEVMASWLHPELVDGVGLVADTSALVPVIAALKAQAAIHNVAMGPVQFLPTYPPTKFEVVAAVSAASMAGKPVAVLSVSGGGRLRDRLLDAISSKNGTLHAIADGSPVAPTFGYVDSAAAYEPWYPYPGFPSIDLEVNRAGEGCPVCREPGQSAVVPIIGGNLQRGVIEGMGRHVLSIDDAQNNSSLWEMLNDFGQVPDGGLGVHLNVPADSAVASHRTEKRMPLAFPPSDWVQYARARQSACEAVAASLTTPVDSPSLVLVPEHEAAYAGHAEFLKELAMQLQWSGLPRVLAFPAVGTWSHELSAAVSQPERIVVVALGAVSGRSLHRAITGVQASRDPGDYGLVGLVGHARPADWRSWKSLTNAYSNRLHAGWITYVDGSNPFDGERRALAGVSSSQRKDEAQAAKFIDARQALMSTTAWPHDAKVFWAERDGAVLSPNSLFGRALKPRTVLAGVGSAVQAERQLWHRRAGGTREVFDLSIILESYFDPLIVCAVLRWLRADEVWWGQDDVEVLARLESVIRRTAPLDQPMLVSELLLAASLGKIEQGRKAIAAHARRLLQERTFTGDAGASLEAGLMLLDARNIENSLMSSASVAEILRRRRNEPELVDKLATALESSKDPTAWFAEVVSAVLEQGPN